MSNSAISHDSQPSPRRSLITAAMVRRASRLGDNSPTLNSPGRRTSISSTFFRAQHVAKAKNVFINILKKPDEDSTPSTPGVCIFTFHIIEPMFSAMGPEKRIQTCICAQKGQKKPQRRRGM